MTHTFRNHKGELISISEVSASKAKSTFGEVLERVGTSGGVAITRHGVPKAVVLSWEEFESLNCTRSESLDTLADQFEDLLAGLQGDVARSAMASAFEATPAELARAAVEMANRNKR